MSTEENDKLARAYADLRADIARSGPGLIKVFRDQLELVLDALAPVQEPVTVLEKDPDTSRINVGDTVELVKDVRHFGEHYPVGTKGTVESVYPNEGLYPYSVKMLANGIEIYFKRSEIRKVA